MFLSELQVGDQGRIVKVLRGEKTYRQRLIAMGLIPGVAFLVVRVAPLGDPVEIRVRGVAVSLRKDEAGILGVERVF